MNDGDLRERVELRKLFGLNPVVAPDRQGLMKLDGMLKDAASPKKFDAVNFVEAMRGE